MQNKKVVISGRGYYECSCDICAVGFTRRANYADFRFCRVCANKNGAEKRSTHGFNNKNSRLHVTWNNMLQRVNNPKNHKYPIYGGAGIQVCAEWKDFEKFMQWSMSNGYSDDLTLDRIDPSGNYEPANCRYVSRNIQNVNKRPWRSAKSGHVGVYFNRFNYRAYLNWKGQRIEIGAYPSAEEATAARDLYIQTHNLPHPMSDDLKAIERQYKQMARELRS